MVNYKNGKIYKIVNDVNNKFYIGSTAEKYLSNRMSNHRRKHNECMSKNLGVNLKECNIILIENYPCKDVNELLRKEREYYDKYKKECKEVFVNKNRPMRYKGENKIIEKQWREDNKEQRNKQKKEYREIHKEQIAKEHKEWRKKNKEKIKKNKKEYYEKNKELFKEKSKKRYENNKEKISERLKEKITCECGSCIRKDGIKEHKKSKKHIKYIESLNN